MDNFLKASYVDRAIGFTVFISLFFVIGLAFPLNAPALYLFQHEALEQFFCRTTYLFFIVLLALLLAPWKDPVNKYINPLLWWEVFFAGVAALSLMQGREKIDYSLLNLMLFLSPLALRKYRQYFVLAIAIAIIFNATYSITGMIFETFHLNNDFFPIIPYKWNGDVKLGPGFYTDFSPGLFYQTNAAGAIFATSFTFFLYRLLIDAESKTLSKVALVFSFVGLFLTRSLTPIFLTFFLTVCVLPAPYRRWVVYVGLLYLTLVTFREGGILGVNLEYLFHKIHTSARMKFSLFLDNWTTLINKGLVLPSKPNNWGTENSFIDTAFQYGMIPTILFYYYCAKNFMHNRRREDLLLVTPLLLSLMQNSALTSPSIIILGLSLCYYGKNLHEPLRDLPSSNKTV